MKNKNSAYKKKKNDLESNNDINSLENETKINNINSNNSPKENESVKTKNNKKNKNSKKKVDQSKINDKEEPIKQKKKNVVIKTKVVDELPKDDVLLNKIKNTVYKLVYVFHNQDNYITVKPELKINILTQRISKKLNMELDKLSFNYNNYEITEKYNDMTVKDFFNFPYNKSRPIIYVKIKQNYNTNNNSNNNLNSEIEKYSVFYKRSYDNKVKISNYPSMADINVGPNDDIYNIVNTFLKENNITSDFTCERKEEKEKGNEKEKEIKEDKISSENNDINTNDQNSNLNSELNNNNNNNNIEENKTDTNNNNQKNTKIIYYIGFPSPDIAFDFNRYMNSLRLMNSTFNNIKVTALLSKKKSPKKNKLNDEQNENSRRSYKNYNYRYGTSLNLEERDLDKRNIEILNIIRNNFLNNKMNGLVKINNKSNYLNVSSPYTTPYEERIKDMQENKKKWLSPKGFISSVNKNSGIFN